MNRLEDGLSEQASECCETLHFSELNPIVVALVDGVVAGILPVP